MSKFNNKVINTIKLLCLEKYKAQYDDNYSLIFNSVPAIYTTLLNHVKFDVDNPSWINRDRVFVSDELKSIFGVCANLMNNDINVENEVNNEFHETIGNAVGCALGQSYLEARVKEEDLKNKLIDFNTYCICTKKELLLGSTFESLSYLNDNQLGKLIVIVIDDDSMVDVKKYFSQFQFSYSELKTNNIDVIDEEIEACKSSKRSSFIFISAKKSIKEIEKIEEKQITEEKIKEISSAYKIEYPISSFEQEKLEIVNYIKLRMNKILEKWNEVKKSSLDNYKISNIINFLETKQLNLKFDIDNLKINDNYFENLITSNNKIMNIAVKKCPFVLNLMLNDTEYSYLSDNRNYCFQYRDKAMFSIAKGLSLLGFKILLHLPHDYSSIVTERINKEKAGSFHYVFYKSKKSILTSMLIDDNKYDDVISFYPADIRELIGVYDIIVNYHKSTVLYINDNKTKQIVGTNSKYVMGGGYRVLKEFEAPFTVLVAKGLILDKVIEEVKKLNSEGYNVRVVSMPSKELFERQSARYKESLLPLENKVINLDDYLANKIISFENLDKDILKTIIDNYN